MAILQSNEIADQRRATIDVALRRRYTRLFQVLTSDGLIGPLEALVHAGAVPPLYAKYDTRPQGGYEYDAGAILTDYDVYQTGRDEPFLWYVRCEYQSRSLDPQLQSQGQGAGAGQEGGHNENPLLRPTKLSIRTQKERRTLYKSRGYTNQAGSFFPAEVPFLNSAGQAYNPGPEDAENLKVLTFVRNEAIDYLDVATVVAALVAFAAFENTVNNFEWFGLPAGSVLCDSIDLEPLYENDIRCMTVSYTMIAKLVANQGPGQRWDWEPIDQGSYYLDANDKPVRPTDTAGNVYSPAVLDGNGVLLAESAEPIINSFRTKRRSTFNLLGLP